MRLAKANTTALLKRETCVVLRARTCALFKTNTGYTTKGGCWPKDDVCSESTRSSQAEQPPSHSPFPQASGPARRAERHHVEDGGRPRASPPGRAASSPLDYRMRDEEGRHTSAPSPFPSTPLAEHCGRAHPHRGGRHSVEPGGGGPGGRPRRVVPARRRWLFRAPSMGAGGAWRRPLLGPAV